MSVLRPAVDAWIRDVLKHDGRVGLARIAENAMTVEQLRDLAKKHGVAPKGYRIETAPKSKLATSLAAQKVPAVLQDVCLACLELMEQGKEQVAELSTKEPSVDPAALEARAKLAEQRLEEMRQRLEERAEAEARQRQREARLMKDLEDERLRASQLRAEVRAASRGVPDGLGAPVDREDHKRVGDLEREIEALAHAEETLRTQLSRQHARIRELEDEVQELVPLVPKGKRRKAEPVKAPPLADEFRLPHLTPAFYRSTESKDRRSIEKAIQAVLLFCTEGPSYPGLEVKQIQGQELWSLRASLKLRVYFRIREDNDIDVLDLVDREDQPTMLRRLKER